jgi:hypothetical protein
MGSNERFAKKEKRRAGVVIEPAPKLKIKASGAS